MSQRHLSDTEARLLLRCAQALMHAPDGDKQEAGRFFECAAMAGDKEAQLSWGLWLARMQLDGQRQPDIAGAARYKDAVRWLSLAGEQGVACAWHAISKIYRKANFSQHHVEEADRYLEKAAHAGCEAAQRELAIACWRRRRDPAEESGAVYWLQQAAAQGSTDAQALLKKIASPASPAAWAQALLQSVDPIIPIELKLRIELAASVGLSIPEALLLDPESADRGHCLVVDIRDHYSRSKRRLILISGEQERHVLTHILRVLEDARHGPEALKGNYHQRLYRLRKLAPDWGDIQRLEGRFMAELSRRKG